MGKHLDWIHKQTMRKPYIFDRVHIRHRIPGAVLEYSLPGPVYSEYETSVNIVDVADACGEIIPGPGLVCVLSSRRIYPAITTQLAVES